MRRIIDRRLSIRFSFNGYLVERGIQTLGPVMFNISFDGIRSVKKGLLKLSKSGYNPILVQLEVSSRSALKSIF